MTATVSKDRYNVKLILDKLAHYPPRMREKARSEYGNRLAAARKHAGLTQHAIAKAVGMSQSAYAGAETTGQGSTYTSQLAAACGVSAEWLATGQGDMLDGASPAIEVQSSSGDALLDALNVVAKAIQGADAATLAKVDLWFPLMVKDQSEAPNIALRVHKLLTDRVSGVLQDDNAASGPRVIRAPKLGGETGQHDKRDSVQKKDASGKR